jgi:hypothetical protein
MAKIIKKHGEYFPKKDIWLVFDMSNGHKKSHQYVWYFRTKTLALEWIKIILKKILMIYIMMYHILQSGLWLKILIKEQGGQYEI